MGKKGGDVAWLEASASIGTVFDALEIMRRSPEFSPEVKGWAKAAQFMVMVASRNVPKFRNVMRQWCRDNKRHFQAEGHGAVQPGAPLVKPVSENDGPSAPSSSSSRVQTNPANPTSSPAISAEPASSPLHPPRSGRLFAAGGGSGSAAVEQEKGGMKVPNRRGVQQRVTRPSARSYVAAKVFRRYSRLLVAMVSGPSVKSKTSTETTPSYAASRRAAAMG